MKSSRVKAILISILLLFVNSTAFDNMTHMNMNQIAVTGTKNPVINLNGTWKFTLNPTENFWMNNNNWSEWYDIDVPGECAMQGFAIKHNVPYVYKKEIIIPEDYQGKIIKLKFHGVYAYTRIWVNGQFIRDHYGGFTAWECDITNHVTPGNIAQLTVEFTDLKDDISYGSGYAKHQIGGILRDVELMALPKDHLKTFYVECDLDENYQDATLSIEMEKTLKSGAKVELTLLDIAESFDTVFTEKYIFPQGESKAILTIPVSNPKKWDAEHPNLYKLRTQFVSNGKASYSFINTIGFREIEVRGNKLLVNGKPIKLRGACRHDIHPLLGRMTTPEYDKKDVLLAKEANINFIRTSHYPPSESFLSYCDKYGIYVEDETAVCFVNTHRTKEYKTVKQSGPEFKQRYLGQLAEMIHYHRNHPSVIIWSIGNENKYDTNFKLSYDYIKSMDATRPVMFSYPGEVPKSIKCYDILSMHYPSYKGRVANQHGMSIENFEYDAMPVLFDEWAHVSCYNKPTLQRDPNVRNFWGQSLDSMWTYLFESKSGLGGAIWGMIDETFMLPETLSGYNQWWGNMDEHVLPSLYEGPCVGYGEWGIIDTWRRKKPEFWHTKKAYSPTKILIREIKKFKPNGELKIPVYNRFDHTNFNEIQIQYSYQGKSRILDKPNIAPHQKGTLIIPGLKWEKGEYINIKFYKNESFLIDEYNIRLGVYDIRLPTIKSGNITTAQDNDTVILKGDLFSVNYNRKNGLMENLCAGNDTLIKSGPYLNIKVPGKYVYFSTIVMDDLAKNWELSKFDLEIDDGIARIYTEGSFDAVSVRYMTQIDAQGLIIIDYSITSETCRKNLQEVGIRFDVGDRFDKLTWDRNTYWTQYPSMHLGIPEGNITLNDNPSMAYRKFPNHPWEMDIKDFYYHGIDKTFTLNKNARSLKENIYEYALITHSGNVLQVVSDARLACRFDQIKERCALYINSLWDYTSLLWGNYMKQLKLTSEYSDRVILQVKNISTIN